MNSANSIKNKNRGIFWCLLVTLLLLIMVRYAFQTDVPRIVFLFIIALTAILGDRNEIVALCICFIPMHESIDFYYALVICVAIYMFKYLKSVRFGYNLLIVLAVAIWELLHCLFTSFDIVQYLVYIIPFIILAVLMASDAENLDYPFIVRAFAYSVLGITLILFIRVLYFSDFNIVSALAGLQRMGSDYHSNIDDVTISGAQINPNSLGIIAVLASTGLMQLRSMKAGRKSDMFIMCIILVLSALGTSRTYVACLAMMIILLIASEKGGMRKKIQLFAILFGAVAVSVVAMAILFPETFEYFVGRFFEDDITTGRGDAMLLFHRFIMDNPKVLFFGLGLQDYSELIIYTYRVWNNIPHNFIQEIIIAWGIPGILLFVAQFISMYTVSLRKNRNISMLNWSPLIIILFKSLAGQLLTSSYTMLALSFAYLSLCQNFYCNKQGE